MMLSNLFNGTDNEVTEYQNGGQRPYNFDRIQDERHG